MIKTTIAVCLLAAVSGIRAAEVKNVPMPDRVSADFEPLGLRRNIDMPLSKFTIGSLSDLRLPGKSAPPTLAFPATTEDPRRVATADAFNLTASFLLNAGPVVVMRKHDEAVLVPQSPSVNGTAVALSLTGSGGVSLLTMTAEVAESLTRHLAAGNDEAAYRTLVDAFDKARADQRERLFGESRLEEFRRGSLEKNAVAAARTSRLDEAARLLWQALAAEDLDGEIDGAKARIIMGFHNSHDWEGSADDLHIIAKDGPFSGQEYRFFLKRDVDGREVVAITQTPESVEIRTRLVKNVNLLPALQTELFQTITVTRRAGKPVALRLKQEQGYPGQEPRLLSDVQVTNIRARK